LYKAALITDYLSGCFMQLPPTLLSDIHNTILSGYYERLTPVRRERKSLSETLEREMAEGRLPLILEVATARPGGRLLLPNRSQAADMLDRLSIITPTAMSIWVEPRHMAGDLRWLSRERPFPLISKDFVIDSRQIVGGDAIMLSRSILALAGVDEHPLIEAAHDLDMEVVLEVRTQDEMASARQSEADVISIHNAGANGGAHRALPDGAPSPNGACGGLDINTTLSLLSSHRTTRPTISSLGVHTPAQARQILTAGATAIELDAEVCASPSALDVIAGLKRAVNGKEPAAGPKNEVKTS